MLKKEMKLSSLFSIFILFLICSCLLYWQGVFSGKALYWRDILHTYLPFHEFIQTSILNGHFPLWNPYVFTGSPQFAVGEPPILYPGTWFFIVFDFSSALIISLLIHHVLAALGCYYYCRLQGWQPLSCTFCGILFAFSGIFISMHNIYPLMWTCTWIPWLFWAVQRLLKVPGIKNLCLFSSIYALQIFSGHLEIVYFTSLLLLLYTIYYLYQSDNREHLVLKSVSCIFALAAGIAMTTVQLLPTIELLDYSVRQSGVGLDAALRWSYHPIRVLALILPDIFGDIFKGTSVTPILGESFYGGSFLFLSTYVGLATIFLVIVALFSQKKSFQSHFFYFWLSICVVTILLSMGSHVIVYKLMYQYVPGFQFFRYPVKILVFTSLGLSLLAAYSIEYLQTLVIDVKAFVAGLLLLGFPIGGSFVLLEFNFNGMTQLLMKWLKVENTHQQWVEQILLHMKHQIMMSLFLLTAITLCLIIYQRKPRFRYFALSTLVVVATLDLISSGLNIIWVIDREFVNHKADVARDLQDLKLHLEPQARMIRAGEVSQIPVEFLDLPYLGHMIYHIGSMNDNFALRYQYRNAYARWAARLDHIDKVYGLYSHAVKLQNPQLRTVLETMLGVKYILDLNVEPDVRAFMEKSGQYKLLKEYPRYQSKLWENTLWQPRVHFKTQALVVQEEDKLLELLSRANHIGFEPEKHVMLLEDESYLKATKLIPSNEVKDKKWTPPQIISETPNSVTISFMTNHSGYLVLADQYYPGWKALDNGKETPILRANYLQRAVRVSPGEHMIEFKYLPFSFYLGLGVSLTTVFLLICMLGFSFRKPVQDG